MKYLSFGRAYFHSAVLHASAKQRWAQTTLYQKRNATKRNDIFKPVKAQRKMHNLFFVISEAHRNFRNELFHAVEAQRNSPIAERHFRTKLKRNLTSEIEISQHNANAAFFAIFDGKE